MTHAETLITGAQLWTPAPLAAPADIAISDGRIMAVGAAGELAHLAGRKTVRIDAHGAAVLPGFHDAHVHPLAGGVALLGCDLSGVHSLPEYQRLIIEHAARSDDTCITGSGWFGDVFPGGLPDRHLLDTLVPDRPAVFSSHDAHGVWVNSRALALAGIDRDSPDPPAGRIVRDDRGEPTGILLDSAAEPVTALLPAHSPDKLGEALRAAQAHLLSLGITSWHDAIVGEYLTLPDCLPTYQREMAAGTLRARITGSLWWNPAWDVTDLPALLETRARAGAAAGLRMNSVKIMQDGICENHTAAMIGPYQGTGAQNRGKSVIDPGVLNELVTAIDAQGLRVHFHGVGDRAVRECLDAVAEARRRNGPGQLHQIAHLDVVDPADLPRFAELGVMANIQPLWARADREILERKLPLLGEQRARWHFPFGSLAAAGAALAMGSDWPVTSADPLWALHTACTRTAPSADPHAGNPESRVPMQPRERLPVDTAVRAYTLGAAEASGTAGGAGQLIPGHHADLVLLSGPVNGPDSFDQLRVALTMVGGEVLYRA
ncbi:amidohydrolase [Amycolatopsis lurida]